MSSRWIGAGLLWLAALSFAAIAQDSPPEAPDAKTPPPPAAQTKAAPTDAAAKQEEPSDKDPAPPATKPTKDSAGTPQRFIPTEQVRSDFDVSFPVDI